MIHAAIYGRLGGDPVERQTSGGKMMVTAYMAVNVARYGAEENTCWVGVVAFGKTADILIKYQKADLLAAMGQLTRRSYTDREGIEREGWSLNCESIVSARTVRPGGKRNRPEGGARPDFDDEIPL
jgi:single-strand DNA-binding protein